MLNFVLPQIECEVGTQKYGRFVISPLENGYGTTLGNALRRVLLSSLSGAAVTTSERIQEIKRNRTLYGQSLDPFGAFLLITGMQTLALRIERANSNALALAKMLEEHPSVTKVNYPGLESHPQHDLAKRQMIGFGGMMSFEVKDGTEGVTRLVDSLELVKLATSLGGVDTILTVPHVVYTRSLSLERQEEIGITPGLIRVSVGIEDYVDLENDFTQALGHV